MRAAVEAAVAVAVAVKVVVVAAVAVEAAAVVTLKQGRYMTPLYLPKYRDKTTSTTHF